LILIKQPNFFIVGAPKCGTTALSEYLRSHPAVFISIPKEPSFFCFDLSGIQYVSDLNDYERLFSGVTPSHTAIGEASPAYLLSECAIEEIFKYNKDSRIIVMLRNPADMLPSYHSQLVFSGFEDQTDFHKAWSMQNDRLHGKNIPKTCREAKALQYAKVPCFGDQLERLYKTFPQNQILILTFEEFIKNTKATYEKVLKFLDLPDDGRSNFPIINPNKGIKSNTLNKLLHKPPKWAITVMNKLSGSRLHDSLIKLHGVIKRSNTSHTSRQPLDSKFRNELINNFRLQVEKTESITGLDLNSWKKHNDV